jgi:hypothetical protein
MPYFSASHTARTNRHPGGPHHQADTQKKILAEQKRTNQLLVAVVHNIESFKAIHAANIDSLRAECNAMAHENTKLVESLLDDQQRLLASLRKWHGSQG